MTGERERAALHLALREVYSGATYAEAEAITDQLDDLGFTIITTPNTTRLPASFRNPWSA